MADAQLVHRVQRAPSLALNVEQVDFAIAIGVFAADEDDLSGADGESRAGPEWVLHSHGEHRPGVLVNIIDFNRVINLLLGRAKEATEGVDELIVDGAGTEIVSFVLHNSHLCPLVLLHLVALDRVQSLLAREAAEDEYIPAALRDGMRISTLIHGCLVSDFILLSAVKPGVLFGRRSSTCDQNVRRSEGDGGGALVEFRCATVTQLLDEPFILVDIIAK